jgi:hypothetical protein
MALLLLVESSIGKRLLPYRILFQLVGDGLCVLECGVPNLAEAIEEK